MADNVATPVGTDIIAADDIGGVKYQRVKLVGGADGVATDLQAGPGTSTAALRVVTASNDPLAALLGAVGETAPTTDTGDAGLNGRLQRIAQALTSLLARLPVSLGIKTAASSLSVTHASDDPVVSRGAPPATATLTSVASSATAVTLMAANASRKGGTIYNDDTNALYVLMGSGASVTAFSIRLEAGDYWELPVCQGGVYTGIVTGIWASAGAGSARATQLT